MNPTDDELQLSLVEGLQHALRDELVEPLLEGKELLLDAPAPAVVDVEADVLPLVLVGNLLESIEFAEKVLFTKGQNHPYGYFLAALLQLVGLHHAEGLVLHGKGRLHQVLNLVV